ncbi:FlgO family outer membrane protein [Pseudoalteromonas luteoviolacea]|uniref:OmpR/PhoB-type domain-containing protein n=1 Tax=Pseudoalteromonas luteoviolacea H33 TaxID=1365251 RepID=A0A167DWF3_9GAMM|nr:FlgO family outer membrane protein [Pseudoalteromonas luteoviolacea]KZN49461.1 hypothetical protein N476_19445 [Pseudoalteromonas luteoviolacea H33]KZN72606.1 hypothetical protein N477_24735 [Pseudoalteromonas luteoviolacea H33-S]MBQ4876241.1 winged helix-turn-helix domain-containing protein [Pseudoalteromonas luteoviolacea]MBQ4906275.1 winged helix-turn-helix domain-containing protein [Pseudoalteromonas luteoviolacea]
MDNRRSEYVPNTEYDTPLLVHAYQLGPWQICPKTNRIKSESHTCVLDNKSMQFLLLLIKHAGQTVDKASIFEQVWAGKVVSADILSVTMSKIRKALNDDARNPKFIKTIPNEGYVLIVPVDVIAQPNEKTAQFGYIKYGAMCVLLLIVLVVWLGRLPSDQASTAQVNVNSIAVLPFEDLSPMQDSRYFATGLSDGIIHQLAQIKSLKVISRDSSFAYQSSDSATEVGKALQVDAVLTGNIQKMAEQIRVQVRVIDTQTGQLLWSKTFDENSKNSFKLQDEVSTYLLGVIYPDSISSKPIIKTLDAQAYEWYLMGQYHWRQRSPDALQQAVGYFKHSLEREPDYVDAHIGLAVSYALSHTYGSMPELKAIEAAMPHIAHALQLAPDSAMGQAAYGMILSDKAKATGDFALYRQAEAALVRALEIENSAMTHLWYATLLARLGKQLEAVAHLEQAIVLNPLSASLKRELSFLLKAMNKSDLAQRKYQQALLQQTDTKTRWLDFAKVHRHSKDSILAMLAWQQQTPELFESCSSIEVCEQQVLAYLSVGATQAAQALLNKMQPLHGHFRHSLTLFELGSQQQDAQIFALIQARVFKLPYNAQARFELAHAQFRAAQFKAAQNTLLQLYPQWQNQRVGESFSVTADNYQAVTLYAAALKQLHDVESAEQLLHAVKTFILQGDILDRAQAQLVLAQVHAQLGHTSQALAYLNTALKLGWMDSFNQQWWTLEHDHLLAPLHNDAQFSDLLEQHMQNKELLRIAIEQEN